MSAIKGGDFVGVGGAFCVVPETCRQCGAPAESFESTLGVEPRHTRVDGFCGKCAWERAEKRAWRATLSREDRWEWDYRESQVAALANLQLEPTLTRRQRRDLEGDLERAFQDRADFARDHAAPAHVG